jgi:hypothetical protein
LESANDLIRRLRRDSFPEAAIAAAYLSLGRLHRAFEEWQAAQAAAQETLRRSPDTRTERESACLARRVPFEGGSAGRTVR